MVVDKCTKCGLCKYPGKQCMPKGTENPMIYVVGEAPGPEEREQGLPFVGRAGKYITDLMNQLGLTESNCRFFNVVRCYPQKSDEDTGFRAPNDEEVSVCSEYLLSDISATHPKVIVPVGATSARFFIKDDFSTITHVRGNVYQTEINGESYIVIPTYHPSYLMRQYSNQSLRDECISDFKKAIELALGADAEVVIQSTKKDYEDDTDLCLTYADFNDFCEREIDTADVISYDIETNAKKTFSDEFKVVGFSLASRKDKGCYVVIDSLDYQMPKRDLLLVKSRMRKILTSKSRILTYNCMYELPGTLNWANVEIEHVFDVFVMVKIMVGDSAKYVGGRGLKAQCQLHLGYKDWSIDLDQYLDALHDFSKKQADIARILLRYYSKSEVAELLVKIENLLSEQPELISGETTSYGLAPYKLIGKYGGIDAEVLFPLQEYYNSEFDRVNREMGIDLHKGCDYWLKHHIAAYTLERNGAYWDDEEATNVDNWCKELAESSLRYLISSPLTLPWIRSRNIYWDYIRYLRLNKINEVLGVSTSPMKMTKNTMRICTCNSSLIDKLSGMSLSPEKETSNGQIYKIEMGHFESLSKPYREAHPEEFEEYAQEWITAYLAEDHSVEDMRNLFNPMSTTQEFKDAVSDILVTPEIRYARIYDQILMQMEAPGFSIEDTCKSRYNDQIFEDDKKLLTLVDRIHVMEIPNSKKLEMFSRQLQAGTSYKSWMLKKLIKDSLGYRMDSLDDDHIIDLYRWYTLSGVDIEDESTWTDNFRWLYNYRVFKKASKIISVYIDGRVGRQNVYCANEESVRHGDILSKTIGKYEDHNGTYVLHTEFKATNADTGRWKATMHTMPSGRTIKRIIKSRFPGGVIFCPDCSQAEVRVLARVANDENLNKAFDEGLDIHKFVASKAFQKDMSEVTKAERSYAKGAVFGILYGESQKSFADSFTHGDMARAQEIFDNIFNAFPGIKTYIEESHQQFRDHKKITLLTDRFIDMTEIERQNGTDVDRVYRQCQNYRIQGATCLAGDTKIKLLDGTQSTIKELADTDRGFYLYSYDESKNKIVPSFGYAYKTKDTDCIYEITLDNGSVIRCTADHRFLRRDGVYISAENISVGESLMPMYTRISAKNNKDHIDGYEIIKQPDGSEDYTHCIVCDTFGEELYLQLGEEFVSTYNHKVVSINKVLLNSSIPVYDITVPNYHNFVIATDEDSGVVVHNCDLAGLILYKICEYIKDHNMKSKPFCFIHDSIEIDAHPDETFKMIDILTPLFNKYPREAFGVHMASDIVLSTNMGAECEVVEHIHDDNYQTIELTLKGFKSDLDELYEHWLPVYKSVTYEDIGEPEAEYFPRSGLFQKKVTFSTDIGTTKEKIKRKFYITTK